MWNRIKGFTIVNPCCRNVDLSDFSRFHDHLVDCQLVDCTVGVAGISFLFVWYDVVCFDVVVHSVCDDASENFVDDW